MEMQVGPWKIIEKKSTNIYKCQCTCGIMKRFTIVDLESIDKNSECTHKVPNRKDISGETFGEWKVIKPTKKGYYLCRCSCNKEKEVYGTTLRNGLSKSCGHDTTEFKDLTNEKFGNWEVKEYIGNHLWKCKCKLCGSIREVHRYSLVSGHSSSCGCQNKQLLYERMLRDGVMKERTPEQIKIVESKENLENYLLGINGKLTIKELSEKIGLSIATTGKYVHEYSLEELLDIKLKCSNIEQEVRKVILDINPYVDMLLNDKEVLEGRELDIYLPKYKLAIEINGNYWHSTIYKEKKYHQEKTLACIKKGIRLIHIFEYEWEDKEAREKITNIIQSIMINRDNHERPLGARDTEVSHISREEAKEFLEKYHLQGYAESEIHLGLTHKGWLVAVMTFGKPRWNSEYDYEIIRLAYATGIKITGGTVKMFNYFRRTYNPTSVISYCDISKFTGFTYIKFGMKEERMSEPNYVWIEPHGREVLTRYQTQKDKLVKKQLGFEYETEDEIMERLGYLKVYNSGNKVFTWHM